MDLQSERAEGKRRLCRRHKKSRGKKQVGKSNLQAKEEGAPELFQVLGMAEKL